MSLTWKDPPPDRRVFTPEVVGELRANPGRWALIRSYAYNCGTGKSVKHPTDIEVIVRQYGGRGKVGRTELYARAK